MTTQIKDMKTIGEFDDFLVGLVEQLVPDEKFGRNQALLFLAIMSDFHTIRQALHEGQAGFEEAAEAVELVSETLVTLIGSLMVGPK